MDIKKHELGVLSHLDVIDRFLEVKERFVIDAGCGNMHLSKALAERGASVLAIDPDPLQAEKNRKAEVIANVGFAETGADALPVEDKSIDGILFSYSLHHVPAELYESVFAEVLRVLKPDAFCYVMEPVAAGELNEVMRLFHDEVQVRDAAQRALEAHAMPHFASVDVIEYSTRVKYDSWEHFANRYAGKTFNANYTEADVRAEHVRERFMELGEPTQFEFNSPVRVTWLRSPHSAVVA